MLVSLVIITLLFSAFFSGIEIAFISSNKLKLEIDKDSDSFFSKTISIFSENESNFIATMLVGNNISLVIFSISISELLQPFILQFTSSDIVLILIQTIIATIIVLVTAEFIPKTIFRINPNYMLKLFSLPLLLFYYLLYPVVFVMISISEFFLRYVFGLKLRQVKQTFSKIDLDEYLENITIDNENEDASSEVEMLQNALELSNIKVRECMVPRTEVFAVNMKVSIDGLKQVFIDTKFSKLPIFKENIDNIIGYVHSSDLFKNPSTIKSVMLPVPIVPESMPANELLNTFISKNKGIAIVVDEFGGTSGLVTIEDVTEEIVGEIVDEHDKEEVLDKKINGTEFLFSARMEVDLINDKYNLDLPKSEEYETIAGLILSLHEEIPKVGEKIEIQNITLIIENVDEKSIKSVRLLTK
ncbi:MAG: HlyC/CorC family transporter [Flavobacteriales bacterium]|nr:HlyC/CorC family transporter [Flavobacteriales bacterium]MBT7481482.1 HlyC/CorC family transporter [Flavobacteriales bacterium]